MSWHKITFDSDSLQRGLLLRFSKESAETHLRSVTADDFGDFAVFSENEIRDDEMFTVVYLTPAASRHCARLVATYSGVPCDKPTGSELILLLGRGDAERLLE